MTLRCPKFKSRLSKALSGFLLLLFFVGALIQASPAGAVGSIDIIGATSKEQACAALLLNNKAACPDPRFQITTAKFFPGGYSGSDTAHQGNPHVVYTIPGKAALDFPLTTILEHTGGSGTPYYAWIFTAPDQPQLGFVLRAGTDRARLFFVSKNPSTDNQAARDTFDSDSAHIADINKSAFGSYVPPLLDDHATPQQADAAAKQWGIKVWKGEAGSPASIADAGLSSPLKAAFAAVNSQLNGILQGLIENYGGVVKSLLNSDYLTFFGSSAQGCSTQDAQSQSACKIHDVWSAVRDTVNVLFILVLIAIAFFNVLHIQVEYYAIRALLPRFIVSVILVNFSLLLAQIIIDFSKILTSAIFPNLDNLHVLHGTYAGGAAIAGIAAFPFFDTFILLTIAIAVLALAVVLFARIAFIWFLVAIAPIPYLLGVLPLTRSLAGWWWKNFIAFVFIAPLMAVVLFIATQISQVNFGGDQTAQLIQTGLVVALLLLATIVPGLLGGRILSLVSGNLTARTAGLRKSALSRSLGGQMLAQYGKRLDDRAAVRGAGGLDTLGLATGGLLGTVGERRRLEGGLIKKRMDEDKHLDIHQLEWTALHGKSDFERRSAAQTLFENDLVGVPGTLGADGHISLMKSLRPAISDDGMGDLVKAAAKKNFSYFNDDAGFMAMRFDLASKGILPGNIYGANANAVQQLAIRINADKAKELSKGFWSSVRDLPEAASINLSETAMQELPSRIIEELLPREAQQRLTEVKLRYIDVKVSGGMPAWDADRSFTSDVINQRIDLEVGLTPELYREMDRIGATAWGTMQQRNLIQNFTPRGYTVNPDYPQAGRFVDRDNPNT